MPTPSPLSPQTRFTRAVAFGGVMAMAVIAAALMFEVAIQDGIDVLDFARLFLILITTAWLAWGAMLSFVGLKRLRTAPSPGITGAQPSTVILMPICNEDPVETFARITAIDQSVRDAGLVADIAILSDTRDPEAAAHERNAFANLRASQPAERALYYRRRNDNRGRKAGNIEDFIRTSGGAYEFAVILDADSLMDGRTIRNMIAQMQADPQLGLLQTLPRIVGARSFFGRAMQFAASFHGPVFTRGLARMQGHTGPFWGHNAIVRITAFAQSCGLPELTGKPPFGGSILSHDYVEAALLARSGWSVRVDPSLGGSYEEAPENVLSYARRDRRWCQGNLQHTRLIFAPGLKGWSRFVFVQNVMSYVVALLWAGFLLASVLATAFAPPPDYFPEPHLLFPVFPSDRTKEITALVLGVVGLLILPKFAILVEARSAGRTRTHGGTLRSTASVIVEILLSSIFAPILLMFQLRAVLQVLSGQDGGWPANARGEGQLTLSEAIRASHWITATGSLALMSAYYFAPALAPWLLPVCVPMILAPLLISVGSRRLTYAVFTTPEEREVPDVVARYRALLAAQIREIEVAVAAPETDHVAA